MSDTKPHNVTLFEDDKFHRSNETIAFLVTEGRLTLVIRRLFHFLLYCTHHDGIQETYRRPLQEVMTQIAYNSENTEELKERLREMRNMSIEWNVDDRKETRWGTSGMLATVEIVTPKFAGCSMVEWTLAPYVRDRVVDTSTYTELSLRIHTRLRSNASVGLYEICSRYKNMLNHMTPARSWKWWWAQVNGEPEASISEKTEYRYFYRDTLKKAIEEVNEISDIKIAVIPLKKGRTIEKLQFSVYRKEEPPTLPDLETQALVDSLTALGIEVKEAQELVRNSSSELIRKTLKYVNKRVSDGNQSTVRSIAAYFKQALRGRYAENDPVVDRPTPLPTPAAPPLPSPREQAISALKVRRFEDAEKAFKALSTDEILELENEFKSQTSVLDYKRKRFSYMPMYKAFLEWRANEIWGPITEEQISMEEARLGTSSSGLKDSADH